MVENNSNIEPNDILFDNAKALNEEINWFASVVNQRLEEILPKTEQTDKNHGFWGMIRGGSEKNEVPPRKATIINAPELENNPSLYAQFIKHYRFNENERLILILALLPHIQPQLLDAFFMGNSDTKRGFTEFGGVKGNQHGGFLPTIETALFITSGNDLIKRLRVASYFEPEHIFSKFNILYINHNHPHEPSTSGQICLFDETIDFLTTGSQRTPRFSMDFPAKRLYTKLNWEDLVLDDTASKQIEELKIWLAHGNQLLFDWKMDGKIKPGYKALFYGPPGTGKTLTASLLGKSFNLPVYRIDLSMVISKYIGETEKNLEKVFKRAENKNWILFFDEAESLFSKRTNVSDSHDKYANQEVAYLLQRLEEYPSLVILATNMRHNIDDAFIRRIHAFIQFPKPEPKERLKLWQSSFSSETVLEDKINLEQIAQMFDLAGASIVNVVQYASLLALHRENNVITYEDLDRGIKKEYLKEGKTF